MVIKLKDIVDELDAQSDIHSSYFNKKTGKLIMISEEEIFIVENEESLEDVPEWQMELVEAAREILCDNSENYICLPDEFDIHEYKIIENFCLSYEDDKIQSELINSIRGRGAFRMFKDTIHRHDIQDDWYAYREKTFFNIAKDWCDINKIEYIE